MGPCRAPVPSAVVPLCVFCREVLLAGVAVCKPLNKEDHVDQAEFWHPPAHAYDGSDVYPIGYWGGVRTWCAR